MPKFLEDKLKAEYPNNPHAVFGTMNKVGAMKGNKETPKGARMEAKHEAKMHENKEPSAGHKMHPEHPMLHRDSFHKNEHHG